MDADRDLETPQPLTHKEIGRRGGEARKRALGSAGYSALGKAGGSTTARRHGHQFYQEKGQEGGQKTLARHGADHFRAIGAKGRERQRALIELGRQAAAERGE